MKDEFVFLFRRIHNQQTEYILDYMQLASHFQHRQPNCFKFIANGNVAFSSVF